MENIIHPSIDLQFHKVFVQPTTTMTVGGALMRRGSGALMRAALAGRARRVAFGTRKVQGGGGGGRTGRRADCRVCASVRATCAVQAGRRAAARDLEQGKWRKRKETVSCSDCLVDRGWWWCGLLYKGLGLHNWVDPSCQEMCDYMGRSNFNCWLEI